MCNIYFVYAFSNGNLVAARHFYEEKFTNRVMPDHMILPVFIDI